VWGEDHDRTSYLELIEATSGEIYFEGRDILKLSREEMKVLRRDMQIVFQDPYAPLDPRMAVVDIIANPWWHIRLLKAEREGKEDKGAPGAS